MTKTTETVIVEEFDENGKVIKRTTTTKEITQQNDYGLTGNWWEHQPSVTYRGYTGDTTTTATTTISNCCNDEIPGQLTLETDKGVKFQ